VGDYQTNPAKCWNCGTELDGHMNVGDDNEALTSGALSLCIYCGAWGLIWIVEGKVNLMEPDTATWLMITTEEELVKASYMMVKFREENDIGVPQK
jgi:hypothetical protein